MSQSEKRRCIAVPAVIVLTLVMLFLSAGMGTGAVQAKTNTKKNTAVIYFSATGTPPIQNRSSACMLSIFIPSMQSKLPFANF